MLNERIASSSFFETLKDIAKADFANARTVKTKKFIFKDDRQFLTALVAHSFLLTAKSRLFVMLAARTTFIILIV